MVLSLCLFSVLFCFDTELYTFSGVILVGIVIAKITDNAKVLKYPILLQYYFTYFCDEYTVARMI